METDEVIEIAREAGMVQDGDMFFSPGGDDFDVHIAHLERFVDLVKERLAKKIEKLPFGDTAQSFAVWVREQ